VAQCAIVRKADVRLSIERFARECTVGTFGASVVGGTFVESALVKVV
jgi:hypothetical protein